MSPSRIVRNAVILCFLNICLSYEQYALSSDKICSLVGRKRKIKLKQEAESAVVIKETRSFDDWAGVVEYRCQFEVKSENEDGVIAVIQNLSLRYDESGCVDYIQFKRRDGSRSRKFCGQINSFKQMQEDGEVLDGNVGAVLDPGGELDTTIYVASIKLNSNEKLDLEIVYTSYKACSGSYNIYESCGPDAKEVCIWRGLFNDNYVNCPVKCFDEGSCFKSPGGTRMSDVGSKVTIGAITSVLLAFLLFLICLWLLRRSKKLCWSSACSSGSHPTPPASVAEMHPHLQVEEMRTYPTPSAPTESQESASVTIAQDKDLPPTYESLFPGK
ncbi:uncharacterized protein LOC110837237 isoform X2 [Zootermopsis nevadensis]|nr:uncharacterized protein LOC110837237 isoform X2 [Zootermopsis nevadensis]